MLKSDWILNSKIFECSTYQLACLISAKLVVAMPGILLPIFSWRENFATHVLNI